MPQYRDATSRLVNKDTTIYTVNKGSENCIQEESNGNKNKNISKMTEVINYFKNKIINNCEDKDKIFVFDPNEKLDEIQKIDDYIKNRVENRIDFFNCLMHRDKKRYENLQVAIIIIGGSIVIVNSVFDSYYPYILHPAITILGALVVILTSIASFKKYQDRMINFKTALRSLQKEYYLYRHRIGEYSRTQNPNTHANESRFVSTIEDILYKEALGFIEIVKQNKRDNENNGSDQNNK